MIVYGQTVWRKKLGSWLNPEKLVKRIKLLQLVGKESIRGLFLKGFVHQNYRPNRRQRERASRAETEERSLKRSRRTHSTYANYLLLSALSSTIHTSCDTWLIDSGASRHMIGYQELLSDLAKRESHQRIILGDDARYAVRGAGATSFQLKSRKTLKMKDVLHVPGMTSNLVTVSALEDEGYYVLFSRGRVYIQKHGSNEKIEIGIRDGGLYRLTAKLLKALVHDTSHGTGGLHIYIIEPFSL
jgi:hypothetical protein